MNKKLLSILLALIIGLSLIALVLVKDNTHDSTTTPEIPAKAKPISMIIDADIGNSTDDLFALEIAYRLMDLGRVKLEGVIVSRVGDGYADLADLYNTYYGYPNIPIGVERDGVSGSKVYIDYRSLDKLKNSDDINMFARTDKDFSDNLDGCKLYRKILSQAEDHSVKVVVLGFVSAIVHLMESQPDEFSKLSGMELIRQKVDSLYFMGTKLGEGSGLGYNLKFNIPLAKKFLENWPKEVPAYLSPSPVGDAIEYRPEQVLADLAYNERNPIRQVYEKWNCDTGQMMWDPLCVINAVSPDIFTYSPTGTIAVSDEGAITFTETKDGPFRYQIAGNKVWCEQILSYIRYYTMMH